MVEVSVIIPNYNGSVYLHQCLNALLKQTYQNFETIVVDNGSQDDSVQVLCRDYSWVKLLALPENYGFSKAVNEGIYASNAPYVILLNNDTKVEPHFIEALLSGIKKSRKRFSCQAKMLQYHDPEKMDDGGNFYNALGWAFSRGKGKDAGRYVKEEKIFSSCAGAAIYRKSLFQQIGYFDEAHFAYLEDLDVGYRARICGYENVWIPQALVYHVGSGTSGSRYNEFKVRCSSRNNIYTVYKNMPLLQLVLNLPFLVAGFLIKWLFFIKKGYGKEFFSGICKGFSLCKKESKFKFRWKNLPNYIKIQLELWINILKRMEN